MTQFSFKTLKWNSKNVSMYSDIIRGPCDLGKKFARDGETMDDNFNFYSLFIEITR